MLSFPHLNLGRPLSRRALLRGAGAALALPLLDAMVPVSLRAAPSTFTPLAKSGGAHPRAVFCYVPNGVNIFDWVPAAAGRDYALSPTLEALKGHRERFTVLSGLGHPHAKGGHSGADTWLTGADLGAVPGKEYTNSISADQVLAESVGRHTRLPSLELSDQSGTGTAGHSHTLAFDRNGTPLPAEDSPRRVFERLFVPEDAASRSAILRRYAEKRSILDEVLAEAKALHGRLGSADQAKLDEYLTSVRETERRVRRLEEWVDIPKPVVDGTRLQLDMQPGNAHDRPMWIDVMLELTYLALVTDTTRVVTFEWSREAGGYGGGGENHHELSHHGGDKGMLAKLSTIDRFHLGRLERFLTFLQSTDEAGRPMLDQTVVVFGSGMNSGEGGDHSPRNLPLLVAGGAGLGFRHGQHLAHDPKNHPPLANVLLTVVRRAGAEAAGFQDATGELGGV
jgi:hypothetical protein